MRAFCDDGYFRAGDACGFRWHPRAEGEKSRMWSVMVCGGDGEFLVYKIMWAVVDDFGDLKRVA